MFGVVRLLASPATAGLADGPAHGVGDDVGVHDHLTVHIAGGTADRLHQRGLTAQETLLVGIQDRHEGHLGQVQALPQQVDADQHVEVPEAQVAQDLDARQGVHLAVHVAHPHPHLQQVLGEILGHLLRERRDQHPRPGGNPLADHLLQVVDLTLRGLHHHLGVHQAGGTHDLLDHPLRHRQFVRPRRGRQEHHLAHPLHDLVEPERPVVGCRRQAEAVLDEGALAAAVARVLPVQLRNGDVRLVDHREEVVGKVVQQREGRLSRAAPIEVRRVVLDAVAVAQFLQHLQVVGGAHPEALRLEQPARGLEVAEALGQLRLDAPHGRIEAFGSRHIVAGGEEDHLVEAVEPLAGDRIQHRDLLHLVAEKPDADHVLVVRRTHLQRVTAHPEPAPRQVGVVALVLHVHEAPQDGAVVVGLAVAQHQQLVLVLVRATETVDAGHRGHDHHVAAGEQRRGGRVPQPLDLVVDGGVLLDEGVAGRHVRLGLVVVVVGDEVLHPVVREELPQLVGQLGGERLVGCQHECRPLHLLDGPGHGGALARSGDAQQRLEAIAAANPFRQPGDSRRLVAGGFEVGHHAERGVTARRDEIGDCTVRGHATTLAVPRQAAACGYGAGKCSSDSIHSQQRAT